MNISKLIFTRALKSTAALANRRIKLAASAPGAINIVAFHRVVADIDKAEREAIRGLVVSSETFRRHCEMLRRAFDVVSLETAAHFLDGARTLKRPLAVITFDDGYLDFYTVAFPILQEMGLPATNFLPTDFVGSNRFLAHDRLFWLIKTAREKKMLIRAALERAGLQTDFIRRATKITDASRLADWLVRLPNQQRENLIGELERELGARDYPADYRLLDWRQIGEMHRKAIDFGFHTTNHAFLPLEPEANLEAEIRRGKIELEQRLNQPVTAFAYPNGAFNPNVKRAVAAAGFKIAVTTRRKINVPGECDPLALGRISFCEESTRGARGAYSPAVARLRLKI